MTNNMEIDENLYRYFKSQNLSISGDVYNGKRKKNSALEDVTINTSNVSGISFPQRATTTINVYVPDLVLGKDGYLRDGKRLSELSAMFVGVIDGIPFDNAECNIEALSTKQDESMHQHWLSFSLRWYIYSDF